MSKLFPSNTVKTAIMRTIVEQLSYGPAATASFFFLMSLLEEKTVEESKQEVKDKFWPTYKVSSASICNGNPSRLILQLVVHESFNIFILLIQSRRLECFIGRLYRH